MCEKRGIREEEMLVEIAMQGVTVQTKRLCVECFDEEEKQFG